MSQEGCASRRIRMKRRFAENVRQYIKEFPDLQYDGAKIICSVCNKSLFCQDKHDCKRHVETAQHTLKKSGKNYNKFLYDLTFMLTVCNLPFTILDREEFRQFWHTYSPEWKLPS